VHLTPEAPGAYYYPLGGRPSDWQVPAGVQRRLAVCFVLPTARYGRTLGKRFFGIRVVRTVSEAPIGLPRAFAREVCAVATMFLPFLFLIMRLDKLYAQCLHDKLADSTVVWDGRQASRPRQGPNKTA
jgi:uncharacterized RDD family membrane protein YckC